MVDPDILRYIRRIKPIPGGLPSGGRLIGPIQAILFDIYGTLFISGCGDLGVAKANAPLTSALPEVLRSFRIEASPADFTRRLHLKIRDEHQRKQTDGIDWPEIDILSIWQAILDWPDERRVRAFALAYEWAVNPCYPMPGLDHTLRVLRGRGLPLGLISNAQFYTPLLFEWFLGAPPEELGFDKDLTVYSYRYGEAKPAKTLFIRCATNLRAMGFSPASVVYVGNDMANDIRPAAAMGWQTVLFAGDRRSLRLRRGDLGGHTILPDLVITDFRELLDWI